MSKTITFYYDFVSPYSYLALSQLGGVAAKAGANVVRRPIDVIALMGRVGNRPTSVECAAKGQYARTDLGRWAMRLKVPFALNPHFRTINKIPLLLGAIAADDAGQGDAYAKAVFEGVWRKAFAFETPEATLGLLTDAGITGAADIMAAGATLGDRLEANIAQAEADGIFGVPSFVVDGELFFGNDRMMFLEEALAA
jgi:2-hydroxychromene-2-carboxylate isomerase